MKNKFGIILKKEITELFRDKKSLAMMLVIPILIPVLYFQPLPCNALNIKLFFPFFSPL